MYRNETGKLSKKRWFDVSANKNWLLSAIFTLGERRAGPRDAISSDTTKKNRIVDGWLAAIFLQPRPVFPEVQTRDRVEHSSVVLFGPPRSQWDTKSFPSRRRTKETRSLITIRNRSSRASFFTNVTNTRLIRPKILIVDNFERIYTESEVK